jgi:opacity protein-like surface antigen
MRTKLLASAVLAAMFVEPVQAQQSYFGLDLGVASVDRDKELKRDLADLQDAFDGAAVSGKLDQSSSVFRIHVGHFVTDNLALEAGYFKTGSYDGTYRVLSGPAVGTRISTSVEVTGFDISANYFVGGFYVKGGLHSSKIDFEARALGVTISDDESGTGFLLGAGYQGLFTDQFGYRLSYTYMDSIAGESDVNSNSFAAGLIYKF